MGRRAEDERWELGRSTRAAGEARTRLDAHREALGEDAWRRGRLLVSELVSNAVVHGAGRIELVLRPTTRGLHVCVSDEGRGGLALRAPGADGGFGLHLLGDLADRWGQRTPGTSVWFEVDR